MRLDIKAATAQVVGVREGEDTVSFSFPDALHRDAFFHLMNHAHGKRYAVRVELISYEGNPSMIEQGEERKRLKASVEGRVTDAPRE